MPDVINLSKYFVPKLQAIDRDSQSSCHYTEAPAATRGALRESTITMDLQIENVGPISATTDRIDNSAKTTQVFPTSLTYINPPSGLSMQSQHSELTKVWCSPHSLP